MLAEVLASGLGILFWTVAARLYDAQALGQASAMVAAMLTLTNISQLNLPMGLLRFLPGAGRRGVLFVRSAYFLTAVMGALLAAAFVLVAPRVLTRLGFLRDSPVLAAAVVVGVVLWGIFALQDAALTAVRQAQWVPVENGLFSLAKIVLLGAFTAVSPTLGIVLAWLVAMAATLPPVNVYLFTRALPGHVAARGAAPPLIFREVARFVSVDYVGKLLGHLSTTALPLLVVAVLGAESNALFFVAWTVGTSLTLVATNLGYSLTVEGALDERRLAEHGRRVLQRCLQLVGAGAVVLAVAAPWVLTVFGPAYREASGLLRLLAIAVVPASVNVLYLALMRVRRSLRRILAVQVAQCVLMLTLTVAVAPRFSIEGVGIAWLVTELVVCATILPDLRAALRPTTVHGGMS